MPGQAADEGERHEHCDQHQRDGDDRAGDFAHRLVGRFARRKAVLDVALDVLHHDDGVIDDDADGEHEPEQGERIDGEAEQIQHREGADGRYRNGQQRDDRRAPCLQKQDDHDNHERDGFQQRVDHGFDRSTHELRRIVDDRIFHALRHVLLQLGQGGADVVRDRQGVGIRRLEDTDRDRGLVVEQRAQPIVGSAEFDAGDVAQPRDLAARAGFHDNVAELLFGLQTPLGIKRELKIDTLKARRGTDEAAGRLHVLAADLAHHIARRQATLGDLLRIEPDPHRIIAPAEQLHLPDAVEPRQSILDVEHRVIAQIVHVVAVVR